jgi:DNA-directed RNA polymerase subunit omega
MRLEKTISKALQYAEDDTYILSLMVAKRSNDLAEGAEPLIKVDKEKVKLTDIALMEIAEGLVQLDKIVEE